MIIFSSQQQDRGNKTDKNNLNDIKNQKMKLHANVVTGKEEVRVFRLIVEIKDGEEVLNHVIDALQSAVSPAVELVPLLHCIIIHWCQLTQQLVLVGIYLTYANINNINNYDKWS